MFAKHGDQSIHMVFNVQCCSMFAKHGFCFCPSAMGCPILWVHREFQGAFLNGFFPFLCAAPLHTSCVLPILFFANPFHLLSSCFPSPLLSNLCSFHLRSPLVGSISLSSPFLAACIDPSPLLFSTLLSSPLLSYLHSSPLLTFPLLSSPLLSSPHFSLYVCSLSSTLYSLFSPLLQGEAKEGNRKERRGEERLQWKGGGRKEEHVGEFIGRGMERKQAIARTLNQGDEIITFSSVCFGLCLSLPNLVQA